MQGDTGKSCSANSSTVWLNAVSSSIQESSIQSIKSNFEIYGRLEKIEILHDVYNNTRFAHITFADSRTANFAMVD